jgi:hypothetical protein
MMQTVQKWKVLVHFSLNENDLVFWVNENHMSNVLRKIADMQFTENGLEQPVQISIIAVK